MEERIPTRRGRSSRHFASATASLSEGVMSKPTVSYSTPPPKPKVSPMLPFMATAACIMQCLPIASQSIVYQFSVTVKRLSP